MAPLIFRSGKQYGLRLYSVAYYFQQKLLQVQHEHDRQANAESILHYFQFTIRRYFIHTK